MPRKGLCLPPNEDGTGHSVQILLLHFGPGHPVQYRMMTILSMAHGLKLTIARR